MNKIRGRFSTKIFLDHLAWSKGQWELLWVWPLQQPALDLPPTKDIPALWHSWSTQVLLTRNTQRYSLQPAFDLPPQITSPHRLRNTNTRELLSMNECMLKITHLKYSRSSHKNKELLQGRAASFLFGNINTLNLTSAIENVLCHIACSKYIQS